MGRKHKLSRLSRNAIKVLVSAFCILLVGVQVVPARPAEVILLRHAEKPPDESNVHLSATGKERARALVQLFATTPALMTNGPPVALFAARPVSRHHSKRPAETLRPLAKHLKLPILMPYTSTDYTALAKRILDDTAYDGKTVVICWTHDELPQLAEAFGIKPRPPPWHSAVFDRLWIITYRGQRAELNDFRQKLVSCDFHH